MSPTPPTSLEEAYARLCEAYCRLADAGQSAEVAGLYAADGVFDRIGQRFEGREAIRALLAARPPGVWTQHVCSNLAVTPGVDPDRASAQADLYMRRGREGSDQVEEVRARYHDQLVRGPTGWQFALREVRLQK